MRRWHLCVLPILLLAMSAGAVAWAQRGRFNRSYQRSYQPGELIDRGGVPDWKVNPDFRHDVFTFVRIQYDSAHRWDKWMTDYPDGDFNFPFRLHELTAIKVDPTPKVLRLTDKELFNYPFIYIVEPGDMVLSEDEVVSLRHYLLNGGFLMVDDFWGVREWMNFYHEIKRVFPDREPRELPLEHEVFHCVYDLKEKPQIPNIHHWFRNGPTSERDDAPQAYYKGIFDDKGRMMSIICHNTDLGDGWEREGDNVEYFHAFSEKYAYPLGINIVVYAMTH